MAAKTYFGVTQAQRDASARTREKRQARYRAERAARARALGQLKRRRNAALRKAARDETARIKLCELCGAPYAAVKEEGRRAPMCIPCALSGWPGLSQGQA